MVNKHIYYVDDFGAKGDGISLDTKAVQLAINACFKNGGGKVSFTVGKSYLIGTIYLKSNMTFYVPVNTKILGSHMYGDYKKDTGLCPYYPEALDRCLIYAKDCNNITIDGKGTIDGQQVGHLQYSEEEMETLKENKRELAQRPMLIRFEDCSNIVIKNITLKSSFSWCTHIKKCNNVKLNNVDISNEIQDGFNIESSKDIIISNCHLRCGDDGIALTTSSKDYPLKNLVVTNCIISSRWAAFRIGPLSKGNFENITLSNCIFKQCGGGGIKIGMFEGAHVKNCMFSNILMDEVTAPILMFISRWSSIGSTEKNPPMMPVGKISNIKFSNIHGRATAGKVKSWNSPDLKEEYGIFPPFPDRSSNMMIHGYPGSNIENISLENISITYPGMGTIEQSKRRDIVDMDQIDIHKNGYWTDAKDIWGVMPAYGLFTRHVMGLKLFNIDFSLDNEDMRPSILCIQTGNIKDRNISMKKKIEPYKSDNNVVIYE